MQQRHLGRAAVRLGDDGHLYDTDLEDLLAWRIRGARSKRVVGHLAWGCGACRARFRERVEQQAREWPGEAGYDGAFAAALVGSRAACRAEQAKREAGAALWVGVRQSPAGRRATVVLNSRRYRTAGVLEAVLRDYREGGWREPQEGLAIAELAVALAERLDPGKRSAAQLADLRAEAQAIAADANRLMCRHREAARLLVRAARTLDVGSGDPLLQGLLLRYAGSFWQAVRRRERAVEAFRRAEQVYRGIGEIHLAARSLVARAEAIGHLHPEEGIRLIRWAIPEIDGERDPLLELAAHHSLAWYLNDAGQGLAARSEVTRSAELYQRSGDAVAGLSRAWLEGRIDRSLYELDGARRWYERAWAGFEELDMQAHLTMLAIDRAELQVATGEPGGAATLLGRTLVLVSRLGVDGEAQRALWRLREAVVAGRGERTGFRRAALAVRRSWTG
jgi:tetratricopeptide (TPR) repeat protein